VKSEKKFDEMYNSFHSIPSFYRRTDRRTETVNNIALCATKINHKSLGVRDHPRTNPL